MTGDQDSLAARQQMANEIDDCVRFAGSGRSLDQNALISGQAINHPLLRFVGFQREVDLSGRVSAVGVVGPLGPIGILRSHQKARHPRRDWLAGLELIQHIFESFQERALGPPAQEQRWGQAHPWIGRDRLGSRRCKGILEHTSRRCRMHPARQHGRESNRIPNVVSDLRGLLNKRLKRVRIGAVLRIQHVLFEDHLGTFAGRPHLDYSSCGIELQTGLRGEQVALDFRAAGRSPCEQPEPENDLILLARLPLPLVDQEELGVGALNLLPASILLGPRRPCLLDVAPLAFLDLWMIGDPPPFKRFRKRLFRRCRRNRNQDLRAKIRACARGVRHLLSDQPRFELRAWIGWRLQPWLLHLQPNLAVGTLLPEVLRRTLTPELSWNLGEPKDALVRIDAAHSLYAQLDEFLQK